MARTKAKAPQVGAFGALPCRDGTSSLSACLTAARSLSPLQTPSKRGTPSKPAPGPSRRIPPRTPEGTEKSELRGYAERARVSHCSAGRGLLLLSPASVKRPTPVKLPDPPLAMC